MFIISLGILTKQSSSTITLELYVSIKTIPLLRVKAPNNLAVIYVEYLCSLNFKVQDYRAKKVRNYIVLILQHTLENQNRDRINFTTCLIITLFDGFVQLKINLLLSLTAPGSFITYFHCIALSCFSFILFLLSCTCIFSLTCHFILSPVIIVKCFTSTILLNTFILFSAFVALLSWSDELYSDCS